METNEKNAKILEKLHLTPSKIQETLKNQVLTQNLTQILTKIDGTLNPQHAVLIYHLASKIKPQIQSKLDILVRKILENKLDTTIRVEKALEYCLEKLAGFDENELEEFCGVGVVVSIEEIEEVVGKLMEEEREEILKLRYRYNVGKLMGKLRDALPWADGKLVKKEVDLELVTMLGPKTGEDLADGKKKKKKEPERAEGGVEAKKDKMAPVTIIDVMKKVNFHKPGENYKTDGYIVTENTQKLLEEHLKVTGGKVRTRFPPEPNGILHIGHAKAININFGYAKAHNGLCFLRYDDTNPEKEEEEFFNGIKDMVEWLGYKPHKITHSSDYFDQLYLWAVELIKKGEAYVCHQSSEEIKGFNPPPSPWRDRPVSESLQLFEDMKNGKIEEGAASLRLKMRLEEGKQDPVAYRIKFMPHHRTDQWIIYPTYDYCHALCDSIEQITHSLCTKEFQNKRLSYYKLVNLLNLYCPVQFEYSRLNIKDQLISKRKIKELINAGLINSWDDPRIYTLSGLRRRGFNPEAINNFCANLGLTGSLTEIDKKLIESFVRDNLNLTSPRTMVVLNPLQVKIVNLTDKLTVNYPINPQLKNDDHCQITLTNLIYIERDDFNANPDSTGNYKRLTLNQSVGLRHTGLAIKVKELINDSTGNLTQVNVECEKITEINKPKAFIHWISTDSIKINVNYYDFDLPLTDGNSLIKKKGFGDRATFKNCKIFDKFQFERIGYFCVDPDSDLASGKVVVNRTLGLKEDSGK